MGTTVSTNLSLIKPDGAESIKANMPTFPGWAAQNATSMDIIDNLFRAQTNTYTLTFTATTTPPTLGTGGGTEGKFVRLHPRMVAVYFKIFFGTSGISGGSGEYNFNLPVAMDSSFASFSYAVPLGKMTFLDSSANLTSSVFSLFYRPSANAMFAKHAQGGMWTATTPVAPAVNDRYSGYFVYPTEVA